MIEAPKKVNNNGVEQHAPDDTEEIEPNDNRKFHQQSVMSRARFVINYKVDCIRYCARIANFGPGIN
ncbi:hypothetical protein INT45_006282 [Circinella minor]|uniref:Uncharacterized protein n=1 Tax=Circinella minor TaxID=1195481 RepID=A0A8H7RXX0_9FUNG|nr:hypothetical protein INT45_006282 [Circinella minor]